MKTLKPFRGTLFEIEKESVRVERTACTERLAITMLLVYVVYLLLSAAVPDIYEHGPYRVLYVQPFGRSKDKKITVSYASFNLTTMAVISSTTADSPSQRLRAVCAKRDAAPCGSQEFPRHREA